MIEVPIRPLCIRTQEGDAWPSLVPTGFTESRAAGHGGEAHRMTKLSKCAPVDVTLI
jgi:hypothetical protein